MNIARGNPILRISCEGGGGWEIGFSGFGYFFKIGFSVFVPTNVGFSVLVCIAVCGFSVRSIWFLVFVKSSNRFSNLVSDVSFGFVLFGLNGNKFIALDGFACSFRF